ncbi:MAG: DUF748 domain-containing protein, partial [Bdellovibrionales bacterium]|nr:DUF748 domain-containing protein [Bdellovibrionales bacterium]
MLQSKIVPIETKNRFVINCRMQILPTGNIKRALLAVLAAFEIYLFATLLVVPWWLHNYIEEDLSRKLGVTFGVQQITFNPFNLRLDIFGLQATSLSNSEELLLKISDIGVNFQVSSLFGGEIDLASLSVENPQIYFTFDSEGDLNLIKDFNPDQPRKNKRSNSADSSNLPAISVDLIQVSNGRIYYLDKSRTTDFSFRAIPVDFEIQGFSTTSAVLSPYRFEAEFSDGSKLTWLGQFSNSSASASGSLELSQLKATTLVSYLGSLLNLTAKSGTIDLALNYDFNWNSSEASSLRITDGSLAIDNLALIADSHSSDQPASFSADSLQLEGISSSLKERTLLITRVISEKLSADLELSDKGLNVLGLWNEKDVETDKADTNQQSWDISISTLSLNRSGIRWIDHTTTPPVRINAQITRLSGEEWGTRTSDSWPLDLAFEISEGGSGEISGSLTPASAIGELQLKLKEIALKPFESYLGGRQRIDAAGNLNFEGKLELSAANDSARAALIGSLQAQDFHLSTADQSLVSFETAKIDQLSLKFLPFYLEIQNAKLDEPKVTLILSDKGTNFTQVFSGDAEETNSAEQPEPVPLRIEGLQISAGEFHLTDLRKQPTLNIPLSNLNADITTKQASSEVDFNLTAEVHSAPIKATGNLSDLQASHSWDLELDMKNLDLVNYSTSIEKLLGYPIEKGLMSAEIGLQNTEQRISGVNRLTLKELDFGTPRKASKNALPLKMATALLADSSGKFELKIPISGDLSRPDFSYGNTVLQTLRSTILTAVSSPLTILASLIPESAGELRQVHFDAGEN